MLWFVAISLAQDGAPPADGRLPGAMPVRVTPVEAPPAPAEAPPPAIDRSKIALLVEPEPPPDRSPWVRMVTVVVGVFGAVLGTAMFAGRLIAPAAQPKGATPRPDAGDPAPR